MAFATQEIVPEPIVSIEAELVHHEESSFPRATIQERYHSRADGTFGGGYLRGKFERNDTAQRTFLK